MLQRARSAITLAALRQPMARRAIATSSPALGIFQPFSVADEAELTKTVTAAPRHVARRVRQMTVGSKRKVAQFRNTVTYLMITVQTKLKNGELNPEDAAIVMEGVLSECVALRQADMAHLLFRASLRFRKYGLKISPKAVELLHLSYRGTDSKELLRVLGEEMNGQEGMQTLSMLSFAFAGLPEKAFEVKAALTTPPDADTMGALASGFYHTGAVDSARTVVNEAVERDGEDGFDAAAVICTAMDVPRALGRLYRGKRGKSEGDIAWVEELLNIAIERQYMLNDKAVATALQMRLVDASAVSDLHRIEGNLRSQLGIEELGAASMSVLLSRYSELVSRGFAKSDEAMLGKVYDLQSIIEAQVSSGHLEDVEPAYMLSLVRGYGVLGKLDEMRRMATFIEESQGYLEVGIYDELMRWYAHARNIKEVLALKETMDKKNIFLTSSSYASVFRALGGFYPNAVRKLYQELRSRNINPDSILYSRILFCFRRMNDTAAVQEIFEEMRSKESQGIRAFNAASFATLLATFRKDNAKVDEIVAEAGQRGLLTHTLVQGAVIRCYSAAGRIQDLEELRKNITSPSPHLYEAMLLHYQRQKNKQAFIDTLVELRKEGMKVNRRILLTALQFFGRLGDRTRVTMLLDEVSDDATLRDDGFFVTVATTFSELGDVAEMERVWEELRDSTLTISMQSYNRLLDMFLGRNNMDRVQEILSHMMERVPPNPITTTTVIDMLGKMGRLHEMEAVLEEMSRSEDMSPTIVTYHQVMAAYAKSGDIVKLEETRSKMVKAGIRENHVTYNILFDGYGRAKRYEHLHDVLKERKAKGIELEEMGFITLLNTYARARMPEEVEMVVKMIHETLTPPLSSRLLSTIATAYSFVAEPGKVDEYVDKIMADKDSTRTRDIENVFLVYSRLKDTNKLQSLLDTHPKATEYCYNVCVAAFAKANDHATVARLLELMESKGMMLNTNTSITLSSLLLKAGKVDLAQAVLKWRKGAGSASPDDDDAHVAAETETSHDELLEKPATGVEEAGGDEDEDAILEDDAAAAGEVRGGKKRRGGPKRR